MSDDHAPIADFDDEALERARKIFAGGCEFLRGVTHVADLPEPGLPEVAFAGRSNVGKSSLINALTGRKALARISNTPGRTRELNYFRLADRLLLVDMPGYGYARASRSAISGWTSLIRDYLRGRAPLRRVFVLIDARHGLKTSDREILTLMDGSAVSYQAVLTKSDKLTGGALGEAVTRLARDLAGHPAAHPELVVTSARSGTGIATLRAAVIAAVLGATIEPDGRA